MSENCSHRNVPTCGGAIRHGHAGDLYFIVLLLLILLHTSHAQAGEQVSIVAGPFKPDFNSGRVAGREPMPLTESMFDLPKTYQLTDWVATVPLSAGNFRPRGPSVVERDSQVGTPQDTPMLHGTSVWQRLADYRAHGRVRLLTLWETGGGSVSLQAGKKGEPSLQWTSRSMNRGGATRGVLDQFVSMSMARANRSFQSAAHQNSSEALPRPIKPSDLGMGANK